MTNEQVAAFLLVEGGLFERFEGVVFLDGDDRKMIMVRDGMVVLPLEEVGIEKHRRFSFYDQVHTTGMDIKQALDARAANARQGYDLRDYAQGAFRMRGIGVGQTVELLVIPRS